MRSTLYSFLAGFCLISTGAADHPQYPPQRPARKTPAAAEGNYTILPDNLRQTMRGIGFEIQSDSIASGNSGLPEDFTSVPHDLTPPERERFAREMLAGFRYCRLAGGLYWRGTDSDGKFLQGRWPEQVPELAQVIKTAVIEGVSLEYRSPAAYWKANNAFVGGDHATNRLRCFEPVMADPESRKLVDSLVLHHVGCDANVVTQEVARFRAKFGHDKPLYQNEYEYLWGETTPARCMNMVLHIMNWFQIGEAPSWYWIHALKPITIVLANRSFTAHTFKVASGLRNVTFKGIRYTPDQAGEDCMGVEIGTLKGGTLTPKVSDMASEFWEQQD